jgi:hypothetical protein
LIVVAQNYIAVTHPIKGHRDISTISNSSTTEENQKGDVSKIRGREKRLR